MTAPLAWVLVGPTASGKSDVAAALALRSSPPAPLLSADSMTVYTGMDVGTAKPSPADRASPPSYGFDLVTPDRPFSVADWLSAVRATFLPALRPPPAPLPIVVGGTGLYIRCLTEGLDDPAPPDPALRARAQAILDADGPDALAAAVRALDPVQFARIRDPENPRRLLRAYERLAAGLPIPLPAPDRPKPLLLGIRRTPEDLRARIDLRARLMFENGLPEEVRALRARHPALSPTAAHAIGYREAALLLDGELSLGDAVAQTALRTRQLAKRQLTWFRHQARVHWIDVPPDASPADVASAIAALLPDLPPVPLLALA